MNHGCLHHIQELSSKRLFGSGLREVERSSFLPIGHAKLSRFDLVDGSFCPRVMAVAAVTWQCQSFLLLRFGEQC
jgi:hypothetical protein